MRLSFSKADLVHEVDVCHVTRSHVTHYPLLASIRLRHTSIPFSYEEDESASSAVCPN